MSSWKYGRHWYGHMLVPQSGNESDPCCNAIAIPDDVFARIENDQRNCTLPDGVCAEWLGINDARHTNGSDCAFLATGHSFTEAWRMFGAPVDELHDADRRERDLEYLRVMSERYGIDLSNHPIRMMVGVNAEH
jgi:hypothetical protein